MHLELVKSSGFALFCCLPLCVCTNGCSSLSTPVNTTVGEVGVLDFSSFISKQIKCSILVIGLNQD